MAKKPRQLAGAYATPQLEPFPRAKSERVELIKAKITDRTSRALSDQYTALRKEENYLYWRFVQLAAKMEALEHLLIDSQSVGDEGWGLYGVQDTSLKLPDGALISVLTQPYGVVKDPQALRRWVLAHGYGEKLSLPNPTMQSILKDLLKRGKSEPDGVAPYSRKTIRFVPPKKPKDADLPPVPDEWDRADLFGEDEGDE